MLVVLMIAAVVTYGKAGAQPGLPPTVAAAEEKVRRLLNDPDSATFRDVRVGKSALAGATVCGEVNAKNRMGGYGGYRRFYADDIAAHVADDEGESLDFGTSYALACGG